MTMNRLTVDQIKLDMEKTGMTLGCELWFSRDDCGCPMAIHAVAKNPNLRRSTEGCEIACIKEFGHDYVRGFTDGFDDPLQDVRLTMIYRSRFGIEDGVAARHTLLPLESP